MADELRQAAEREFARLDAEESARETITGECSRERLDRYHLASAVMALHPTDDREAVTEGRLRAAGFRQRGGLFTIGSAPRNVDVWVAGPDRWMMNAFGASYTRAIEPRGFGEVLRLCAAMGIAATATDGPAV